MENNNTNREEKALASGIGDKALLSDIERAKSHSLSLMIENDFTIIREKRVPREDSPDSLSYKERMERFLLAVVSENVPSIYKEKGATDDFCLGVREGLLCALALLGEEKLVQKPDLESEKARALIKKVAEATDQKKFNDWLDESYAAYPFLSEEGASELYSAGVPKI